MSVCLTARLEKKNIAFLIQKFSSDYHIFWFIITENWLYNLLCSFEDTFLAYVILIGFVTYGFTLYCFIFIEVKGLAFLHFL